jgi:hypothetical protein
VSTSWKATAAALAAVLLGALAATTATAGTRAVVRSPALKKGDIPAVVQAIAYQLRSQSLLLRTRSTDLPGAELRQRAPLAHSSFTGFGYCTTNVLPEPDAGGDFFVWAVTDSGHTAVITRSHLFSSSYADFSADVVVEDSPFLVIQYAGNFYFYELDTEDVFGPYDYADAWFVWYWDFLADYYLALVNEAWYYDTELSAPSYYLAPVFGPDAYSANTCYN